MRFFRVRATIPILTADDVNRTASDALREARRRLDKIETADTASVLAMGDDTAIVLENAFGAISLLNSVHPDAAVRDSADRALIDESVFMTEVFQNERLFERARNVVPVNKAQKQLKKDLLESFEDS